MNTQRPAFLVITMLFTFGCTDPAPAPSENPPVKIATKREAPVAKPEVAKPPPLQKKNKVRVQAKKIPADIFKQKNDITQVDGSFVQMLAQKPEFVLKQARIIPSVTPSGIDGMRLLNIEKDTLFERAGFQNGDVIKSALGQELVRPDQLLGLPGRIKEAGKLDVVFTRAGKSQTLRFRREN